MGLVWTCPSSWGRADSFLRGHGFLESGWLSEKGEVWWADLVEYDDLSKAHPMRCYSSWSVALSNPIIPQLLQWHRNAWLADKRSTGKVDDDAWIGWWAVWWGEKGWSVFRFGRLLLALFLALGRTGLLRGLRHHKIIKSSFKFIHRQTNLLGLWGKWWLWRGNDCFFCLRHVRKDEYLLWSFIVNGFIGYLAL